MKTFDWKAFKNTDNRIAVRCRTEEEAKDFCKQMHEHGMRWIDGVSYLTRHSWNTFKENTYYTNSGEYGQSGINYEFFEWSDYMEKPFTKADLKVGDIVKTRQGNILVILPNENSSDGLGTFSRITLGCNRYLCDYKEDLTSEKSNFDIVAVLRASEPGYHTYNPYRLLGAVLTYDDHEMVADQFKYVKWDWERKEEEPIKELTMEELEKHFGCKVKIVAEDN